MTKFGLLKLKFILLIVAGLIAGCSGISVSQDYDRETDFSRLKTYAWKNAPVIEASDDSPMTPLIDERIRNAIVNEFIARRIRLDESRPDFLIDYQLTVESKISSSQVTTSIGFSAGHYGRYGAVGIGMAPDIRQYDEGTLVIDFYLADSKKMVWRGLGSQVVDKHEKPEKVTEQINTAIKMILAQFPPKTG